MIADAIVCFALATPRTIRAGLRRKKDATGLVVLSLAPTKLASVDGF